MSQTVDNARIALPVPARIGRSWWFAPAHLVNLARQRRQLAQMTDDQLADIGVSRAEAEAEAARSFWDVPPHWLGGR